MGEASEILCTFGPQNAIATRECVSQGEWSADIDYSQCYTMITRMYQEIDLVSS